MRPTAAPMNALKIINYLCFTGKYLVTELRTQLIDWPCQKE
jgi:hypothetical protein